MQPITNDAYTDSEALSRSLYWQQIILAQVGRRGVWWMPNQSIRWYWKGAEWHAIVAATLRGNYIFSCACIDLPRPRLLNLDKYLTAHAGCTDRDMFITG